MPQIRNQAEYIKFLEDYMFISEGNRPVTGSSYKLPFLAESIRDYRDRRSKLSPRYRVFAIMFNTILTSVMIAIAMIWGINEVIQFAIPLSLRNISVVSLIFLLGKAKVGLFMEK